jgi:hypothetical protein
MVFAHARLGWRTPSHRPPDNSWTGAMYAVRQPDAGQVERAFVTPPFYKANHLKHDGTSDADLIVLKVDIVPLETKELAHP